MNICATTYPAPSLVTSSQNKTLRDVLQTRWLQTKEVYNLLTQIHLLTQMGYPVQREPHSVDGPLPQSGDLFIFTKEQGKQGAHLWRNDHLQYKLRKSNNSVQESQMKLMIDKKEVITCAYAKGVVCRRAYWLI